MYKCERCDWTGSSSELGYYTEYRGECHGAPAWETLPCCPECGYVFPVKSREIETSESTELIHIEGFRLDFSSPDDCSSYSDLLAYAKKKGYQRGWAFYEARKRGFIY